VRVETAQRGQAGGDQDLQEQQEIRQERHGPVLKGVPLVGSNHAFS
jgi:hypothetical protein